MTFWFFILAYKKPTPLPFPNKPKKPCDRKSTIEIPDKYVFSGQKPEKLYDAGKIELSGKFKGEERDCIN
jgi:hypothetical protein